MSVSIVIPAHNEQENIVEVIDRIEDTFNMEHELIVVNDHSTDATVSLVQKLIPKYPCVRLVNNLNNPGFANAIRTGFAQVKEDVVVAVMADLCDDLATLKEMYRKIHEGYDVVCATRYIRGGSRLGGPRVKAFLSCFAGKSLHYFIGIPTSDIANSFKMYRKIVLDKIKSNAKGFEISMEITLKAYFLGFKITELPTVWRERTKGNSSFRVLKLLPDYTKLYIWAIFKSLVWNHKAMN